MGIVGDHEMPAFGRKGLIAESESDIRRPVTFGRQTGGDVQSPVRFPSAMCFVTYARATTQKSILDTLLGGALDGRWNPDFSGTPAAIAPMLPMRSGLLVVMVINGPMPPSELSDDSAQRAAWPEAAAKSATWKSHVVVCGFGKPKTLPEARAHAEDVMFVASVLARDSGASAVGWPGCGLFRPAADFAERVGKTPLPADIMIRCLWRGTPLPDGAGLGATTRGLHLFNLPEIDHPPTGEDPGAINDRLLNLASYLIANGPVLKDGDTIGIDARATARVRHVRDAAGSLMLEVTRALDA
jgi:hypothetical protein